MLQQRWESHVLFLFAIACSAPLAPPDPSTAPPPPVSEPLPEPGEPHYAASHILIGFAGATRSTATRTEAEALELARSLRDRALSGEPFDALARAHSEGPSAPRGGTLGVYPTGTMVPAFERAVASVEVGAIGPLVQTPFGWHVVRRDAVIEAEASHILVSWAGAWRSKQTRTRDQARARIEEAERLLAAGKDFAEVAKALSDGPTAARGGALGVVAPGQFLPPFEDALFALGPGEVSGVVETAYGFHLIRRGP